MISKPQKTKKSTCMLVRCFTVSIRVVLSRAGDIYVKSLASLGPNIAYGNVMGCPTPQVQAVQRPFCVNSSNAYKLRTVDEDLRKTIVIINGGDGGTEVGPTRKVVSGRIDEETELQLFGEEEEEEEDCDDGVGLLKRRTKVV